MSGTLGRTILKSRRLFLGSVALNSQIHRGINPGDRWWQETDIGFLSLPSPFSEVVMTF
jgi:acyl-coenzyme A synthetase/AMP-(fatty) acid ligase